MRWIVELGLSLALFWVLPGGVAPQTDAPLTLEQWRLALRSIIDSEHAFAQAAAEKGIREAFLAFLSEDAVLFQPQPVPGRKWWLEHAPVSGKLSWWPGFADVSAAGDLGYSTGPYESRKNAADAAPSSFGNYVTIWRRQKDGAWKAIVDFGVTNPAPGKDFVEFNPRLGRPPFAPGQIADEDESSDTLTSLERRLSTLSVTQGMAALLPYLGDEIRLLRADRTPAIGLDQMIPQLPAKPGVCSWQPLGSGSSISGDLGYAYGAIHVKDDRSGDTRARSGHYLRIWKMHAPGSWKIVLDVASY